MAIYLENPAADQLTCRSVALPAPAAGPDGYGFSSWNPFSFEMTVVPATFAYLYILVYNHESSNGNAPAFALNSLLRTSRLNIRMRRNP